MNEPSDRTEAQTTPVDQTMPVDVAASVEPETDTASTTPVTDTASKTTVEEFQINGSAVFDKIKALLQQGNIRRIVIKNEDGKKLFELSLTMGVAAGLVATLIAPLFIALGFVGMLAARLTIVVEKNI